MTALIFGVVTVILIWPAAELLSRARWQIRAPRAAMTLWQAIALAGVLSAFSCGLAIASNLLEPGPTAPPPPTRSRRLTESACRCGWCPSRSSPSP